ncbi:MAG: DUF5036 family protein [Alistipes sp.]
MKINFSAWMLLAALCLSMAACSDDDDSSADPAGVSTLNLVKGQMLGSVQIDANNNFTTREKLVDVGAVRGVGAIKDPLLSGLTTQTAVLPGHGYCVYNTMALMQFPSKTWALSIGKPYVRLFVEKWLESEEKIQGAVVKYVDTWPQIYGLPAYDHTVEVDLKIGDSRVDIELPTADCEYYINANEGSIRFEPNGNMLTIYMYNVGGPGDSVYLYMRVRDSYSRIRLLLK